MGRVLVVEDDPWCCRIARELLELRGHEVTSATDVAEARPRLAGVQLVLLDIHLPGGGGELLLRELRAAEATRALPVIAFTASAMIGDRERFLRQGFTDYISKPIDLRVFGEVIERYVG